MFVDTMTNKAYLEIANSPMLWAMVIPTVLAMCVQAYVFIKDAVKAGPIVGLTKEDTKTTVYGPDYRDPFQDEVKYFYDCIVNGTKPKSDFEDAMADMVLFRDICKKIKE